MESGSSRRSHLCTRDETNGEARQARDGLARPARPQIHGSSLPASCCGSDAADSAELPSSRITPAGMACALKTHTRTVIAVATRILVASIAKSSFSKGRASGVLSHSAYSSAVNIAVSCSHSRHLNGIIRSTAERDHRIPCERIQRGARDLLL